MFQAIFNNISKRKQISQVQAIHLINIRDVKAFKPYYENTQQNKISNLISPSIQLSEGQNLRSRLYFQNVYYSGTIARKQFKKIAIKEMLEFDTQNSEENSKNKSKEANQKSQKNSKTSKNISQLEQIYKTDINNVKIDDTKQNKEQRIFLKNDNLKKQQKESFEIIQNENDDINQNQTLKAKQDESLDKNPNQTQSKFNFFKQLKQSTLNDKGSQGKNATKEKIEEKIQKKGDDNNRQKQNDSFQNSQQNKKETKSLLQQIQDSIPDIQSQYHRIYDTFGQLDIKDNVLFFKDFRQQYKINDVALFGYFSLKEIRECYKNEYQILSFMLNEKIIQRFREHFDQNKKFQKVFTEYFQLPYAKRSSMVGDKFGKENIQFYINFYPLFDIFVLYASSMQQHKYQQSLEMSERLNLKEPHILFPETRKIKRKIIYHYGPTNSGKTFSALNSLMSASSGIYCGPLRLLANEIYQKFKSNGIACNLVTGQEKIQEPDAKFYSCTTEIACQKTDIEFDCAVIDEIQFLGDESRGGAWTQAILGLKAKEIHVCGDGRVLKLIEDICKQTGDDMQTINYQRMSKLQILEREYQFPEDLEEGDCFIFFSVEDTIAFKQKINRHINGSKKKQENYCSIIYGRQPAEIKKMTYKYLVATNAIGLGLNLKIKRIIFTSLTKVMNTQLTQLDKQEILQIAGRAGRYKEDGIVCTRNAKYIKFLKFLLSQKDQLIQQQDIKKAAFFPSFEQIESFGNWLNEGQNKKKIHLSEIFQKFVEYATCQGNYFIQNEDDFLFKSNAIEQFGLPMHDQFIFSQAPIRLGSRFEKEREIYKLFAKNYSLGEKVLLPGILRDQDKLKSIKDKNTSSKETLAIYESLYFILEQYVWLGNKFRAESFPDIQLSQQNKLIICELMNEIHSQNQYN